MRVNIPGATYFITKSTVDKIPIFNDQRCAKIFVDALKFLKAREKIEIHTYVVMPDHYHLLVTLTDSFEISKLLHSLNSYTAHKITKIACKSKIWDDRTWDEVIRTEEMFYQKMAYILLNPWRRGLVKNPFDIYEHSNLSEILEKYGVEFLKGLYGKYRRFGE